MLRVVLQEQALNELPVFLNDVVGPRTGGGAAWQEHGPRLVLVGQ